MSWNEKVMAELSEEARTQVDENIRLLNYYQSLAKERKQGDADYWAIHHTVDRLVSNLADVYQIDVVLDPTINTWSM